MVKFSGSIVKCATLMLLSFLPTSTLANCSHDTIAEVACAPENEAVFGTLCALVKKAGLAGTLGHGGHFTVFAPTNDAFAALPDAVVDFLLSDRGASTLKEILLYHVISGRALDTHDLHCGRTYEMANGKDTRHVCMKGHIFQKGTLNSDSNPPKIINPKNVCLENGIVHTIDKVLLPNVNLPNSHPRPPSKSPTPHPVSRPTSRPTEGNTCGTLPTIAEIACNDDPDSQFTLLCAVVQRVGLDAQLSIESEIFTVFAPTDQAFLELIEELADINDIPGSLDALGDDTILDILLFHAVVGRRVRFNQLECGAFLTMANWEDTETICLNYWENGEQKEWKAQAGPLNQRNDLPWIIIQDIEACNGIVHVVDEVILPDLTSN